MGRLCVFVCAVVYRNERYHFYQFVITDINTNGKLFIRSGELIIDDFFHSSVDREKMY